MPLEYKEIDFEYVKILDYFKSIPTTEALYFFQI